MITYIAHCVYQEHSIPGIHTFPDSVRVTTHKKAQTVLLFVFISGAYTSICVLLLKLYAQLTDDLAAAMP